jgi:hypothetical protein
MASICDDPNDDHSSKKSKSIKSIHGIATERRDEKR